MNPINRRDFVKAVSAAPLLLSHATSLSEVPNLVDPTRQGSTQLDQRYELTLHRVLEGVSPKYTDDFLLADVKPTAESRFTEYSGALSGRYIGALATAARVYGTGVPRLDALVDKVIALQKPEGYFGAPFHFDHPSDADMALLWGNGRLLVGLIEYYRFRPSESVLAASRRIGEFLVHVSPLMLSREIRDGFGAKHFASSYICWTQQTEGLALLYGITKEERYRKLAQEIAAVIERRPGDHVHGYLTSLRGVMELHSLTHDPGLLAQCESAWNEITASNDLLLTGGVPEGWSPNNHRTEGCGEADWVRFNLQLWNATGKSTYLSSAERAIFNELAFNQFATGDFGHRVYTETGLPAVGAARAWWCCSLHGLRCFPDIRECAFGATKSGILYQVPVDGKIESPSLSAIAESDLSRTGTVRIRITGALKDKARVAVRKPAWADSVHLRVSGAMDAPVSDTESVSAEKVWAVGELIEVKYAMKLRSEPVANDREVFWLGPWLLGASAADNPGYFNELTTQNQLLGTAASIHEQGASGIFSIPVAAAEVGYAQAEFPDQPGRVKLRAIAEQTGQPTTSWETRFLVRRST